jgi:hypothetical protein
MLAQHRLHKKSDEEAAMLTAELHPWQNSLAAPPAPAPLQPGSATNTSTKRLGYATNFT